MNVSNTPQTGEKAEVMLRHDFEPFLSNYLEGGYKDDTAHLKKITMTDTMIRGEYDMTSYHMPGDGVFHYTPVQATIAVSQLGIVYCCKDNDISRKAGEVYIRGISWSCRKVYCDTKDIIVTINLTNKREIKGGSEVFYRGDIIVGDGHFIGSAKLAFSRNHAGLAS